MDGAASQPRPRDYSRPPYNPRPPSRSFDGPSNPRMTPRSNNSSSSNLRSSPQLLAHRLRQSPDIRRARADSGDRPRSQLFRETTADELRNSELRQSVIATSSYLQEKLQRERRFESERSSSRLSNDMSASLDLRTIQSSPLRGGALDARRPRSSGGGNSGNSGDHIKKGLGLKEMEQTMTTLHKQNFDLKLELYHRREKQTALEERVETLESEKHELEDINDKLMTELEKRDKAVEEAVAMIVSLEARLDQLLREREMVQQVEKEGLLYAEEAQQSMSESRRPLPEPEHQDARTLARMPSFLSERSENTENLRNVYLGVRQSLLSLPRMSEDNTDADGRDGNGIASPSMSVLSESSLLSIYGPKQDLPTSSSPAALETTVVDNFSDARRGLRAKDAMGSSPLRPSPLNTKSSAPARPRRSTSITRNNTAGAFSSITELMDLNCSPLQRLERMEMSLAAMNEASRPVSQDRVAEIEPLTRQLRSQLQAAVKLEKREILRRVQTDAPYMKDLGHHNLPPTPDTVSTSTLRRFKNSTDTISQEEQSVMNERSYLALSEAATSRSSSAEQHPREMSHGRKVSQGPPSTTAFNSRRDEAGASVSGYFDHRFPIPPRPRSADETTISRHSHGHGTNGWESDSSDELDGNDSASLHDYWLRESLRPAQQGVSASAHNGGSSYDRRPGRGSPDLFSFPSTSNGWATGTMFGSLGGNGYLGAGGAPLAETLDALGESLPTPQTGLFGSGLASPAMIPPPPPNRRSSLHARTGSSAGISTAPGTPIRASPAPTKYRRSPVPGLGAINMSRSNSPDGRPQSSAQGPGQHQHQYQQQQHLSPQKQNQDQMALPKQRHYPPLSGSTNVPRVRGLNIFRRSGSHAQEPAPAVPTPSSAPATETTFPSSATAKLPLVGVPSWGRRMDLEDERTGATPPPILRNPRLPGRGSVDATAGGGGGGESSSASAAAAGAAAQKDVPAAAAGEEAPGNGSSGSAPQVNLGTIRRKWLGGLGRASSLRNRAG